ncbi:unnamed protein product [Linum tenue]|uniref:Uncharacterized protein n=1 Tax=Linum tenue TaxID=586396 RepID=A0AAV0KHS0_9ROSI|nr:unnamed protein product [Linum tenue]
MMAASSTNSTGSISIKQHRYIDHGNPSYRDPSRNSTSTSSWGKQLLPRRHRKLSCTAELQQQQQILSMHEEEADKIRRLQNGSDVRGVALEGEKGRTVDLTPPAVEAISENFVFWTCFIDI